MYTLDDLKAECVRGNINARLHPRDPEVVLYNYTQRAQYDGSWTPAICASRGLILRGQQHIARPFKKFFNVSEHVGHGDAIPEHDRWELYDKVDGSLGVVFWLGDKWEVATRGSFTSPQSIVAAEMLKGLQTAAALDPTWTYMFEIVYPENRIVVNYGERKELVLLGAIHTESGLEMEYDQLVAVAGLLGTSVVVRVAYGTESHKSWSALEDFIASRYEGTTRTGSEAEGFVVRLCSGATSVRAKWKYPAYSQLHKTLSGLTNITVWEHLVAGTLNSLLELMPDEMFGAIKTTESQLVAAHVAASEHTTRLYAGITGTTPATRAAEIIRCNEFAPILFAMQQGKKDRVARLLWEICRPKKSVSLALITDAD